MHQFYFVQFLLGKSNAMQLSALLLFLELAAATVNGQDEQTQTQTIISTTPEDAITTENGSGNFTTISEMSTDLTTLSTTRSSQQSSTPHMEARTSEVPLPVYIGVGGACAAALIITFVILIVCILIWKKKLKETSSIKAHPLTDNYRENYADEPIDVEDPIIQEQIAELERQRHALIPISEFSESVKMKHQNANSEFEMEFEALSTRHESTYIAAKERHNEIKNRFENIFPYDFSRVTLKQLDVNQDTDYINASFINGYNRENAYIAAQGPLRNTIGDFWRMVWEHKLTAIIMLTETIEAGREKCIQYWPALMDTPWNVGSNLSVTLQVQTQYAAYRVKKILVENSAEVDSEPLHVQHFHFSAWPDHGVPADKTCLIQFIQRVRKDYPYYESPPLVVHCSAGVGRSGTFIVLDSMLERMKVETTLGIYSFITEMRKKRALMVQTEAQYTFIHDALDEFITCGDTSIAVTNIRVAIVNLSKRDPTTGQTGYNTQFDLLESVSFKQNELNCNEAQKEYNEGKNRYEEHIPYNINRVCLRPGGTRGADYINASFVDGYKHRRNFIATQAPLKNTASDFWRMVWEQKNRVIVMLCALEEGEEKFYKYWPEGVDRTAVYGKFKVKMVQEEENDNFITRKFEMGEDTPYMAPGAPDAVTVTQFHHTKWPERGQLPTSESILEMINSLLKIQMSTGNHAIVIMCNNGIGRTGTFATVYSQIERIKAEQAADIFQYIKAIRIQRADMVIEESHFRFCHQVLADYLVSVDNYANFKEL